MQTLICGAGRITRELLRLLGDNWTIQIIEKSRSQAAKVQSEFLNILPIIIEDASSPVVLDKANIKNFDYVLAMTSCDQVNLAVCKHAKKKGIAHIAALVHEPEQAHQYQKLHIHIILARTVLAQGLYHYLQHPRIHVTPLTSGPGSLFEIEAAHHFHVSGRKASLFSSNERRLVALMRQGKLIFPNQSTRILAEDHLVLLGETDTLQNVCSFLECGQPHFPLNFGSDLLLALPTEESSPNPWLNEGLFLAQNIKIKRVSILQTDLESDSDDLQNIIRRWPQKVNTLQAKPGLSLIQAVEHTAMTANFGLVQIPALRSQGLFSKLRHTLTNLSLKIRRPVLVSRQTVPYERILVPFSGSANSEAALEAALDIRSQLKAKISVVLVKEPAFFSGQEIQTDQNIQRVNEFSHFHKTPISIIQKSGNPVREVAALSQNYDLVVLASSPNNYGLLSPNIAELMACRSLCSSLVLPVGL